MSEWTTAALVAAMIWCLTASEVAAQWGPSPTGYYSTFERVVLDPCQKTSSCDDPSLCSTIHAVSLTRNLDPYAVHAVLAGVSVHNEPSNVATEYRLLGARVDMLDYNAHTGVAHVAVEVWMDDDVPSPDLRAVVTFSVIGTKDPSTNTFEAIGATCSAASDGYCGALATGPSGPGGGTATAQLQDFCVATGDGSAIRLANFDVQADVLPFPGSGSTVLFFGAFEDMTAGEGVDVRLRALVGNASVPRSPFTAGDSGVVTHFETTATAGAAVSPWVGVSRLNLYYYYPSFGFFDSPVAGLSVGWGDVDVVAGVMEHTYGGMLSNSAVMSPSPFAYAIGGTIYRP